MAAVDVEAVLPEEFPERFQFAAARVDPVAAEISAR